MSERNDLLRKDEKYTEQSSPYFASLPEHFKKYGQQTVAFHI